MKYDEDTLVQATTADYLRDELRWESVYAYNTETFGPEGTLGRKDDTEVVLKRYLGEALVTLNPDLPEEAYQAALREITQATVAQSPIHANREKYELLRDGVLVSYRDEKAVLKRARLRVFDFANPEANHFLCVRELWLKGPLYRRRADIVGFVNGLPLLFMELKNVHRDRARLTVNHVKGFKRLYHSDRSEIIWLPEHIDAFMKVAPVEIQQALILTLHTGQRQGDLLRMPWSAYDGERIRLRQGKSRRGKKQVR
jgi:type I site-specific restriction-modification system R (restriction) subunit